MHLLTDGSFVNFMGLRQLSAGLSIKFAEIPVADVKSLLADMAEKIGLVTIVLPNEAEECGGTELLSTLQPMARQHDFSLLWMFTPIPTAKAVANWKTHRLELTEAGGEA